jgi:GMP synthase (glutamine-hydrolysing)
MRMKRILLVDAVETAAADADRPLASVEHWFERHLRGCADLHTLPASAPTLAEDAKSVDGVMISGSARDAWADSPDVLDLLAFARRMLAADRPVLGVCFGHQLLGRALGGEVRRNPAGWEVGATRVELTPDGAESPLFAGFDAKFMAIQSHRDAILALPAEAKVLATNPHSPIQAFSVGDRVFGVQFHPEMDGEILRHRWVKRREKLRGQVGFDLDAALDTAEADASRVLRNFIALIP